MISVLIGTEYHPLVPTDNRHTVLDIQIYFTLSVHYINHITM